MYRIHPKAGYYIPLQYQKTFKLNPTYNFLHQRIYSKKEKKSKTLLTEKSDFSLATTNLKISSYKTIKTYFQKNHQTVQSGKEKTIFLGLDLFSQHQLQALKPIKNANRQRTHNSKTKIID